MKSESLLVPVAGMTLLACSFLTLPLEGRQQAEPAASEPGSSGVTKAARVDPILPTPVPVPDLNFDAVSSGSVCTEFECLQVCLAFLPEIVGPLDPGTPGANEPVQKGWLGDPSPGRFDLAVYVLRDETLKLTYAPPVPGRLKPYQENLALHRIIWDYFRYIIPQSARALVTNFVVYTDGPYGESAMQVHPVDPYYYLKADLFDLGSTSDMTAMMVHETGHMLTVNSTQLTHAEVELGPNDTFDLDYFRRLQDECGYPHTLNVCAGPGSYLDRFYGKFWEGRHDEVIVQVLYAEYRNQDAGAFVDELLRDYPDEFVSGYAATNMEEDMAESFERFVLGPAPRDRRIADQKVLFFYQFPEFAALRKQIIQRICDFSDQN